MNNEDELKGGFMSQNRFNRNCSNMPLVLSLVALSASIFGLFFGYNVGRDLAIKQNEKDAAIEHQQKIIRSK
jgi:hypothetical protein